MIDPLLSRQEQSLYGPVIIAGMHRSGTSLTASILQKAGVFIGEDLLVPALGNPKGHFEDVEFLSFHQEVLISQGIASEGWTTLQAVNVPQQFWGHADDLCERRIAQNRIWGWKEPRTTLFLDFWESKLPHAKFILPYRSPWEVMNSLFARGDQAFQKNPKFVAEVWIAYDAAILDFYQRHPQKCLLVHPLALRQSEHNFIAKVAEKFHLSLTLPDEKIFQADIMHLQVNDTHRPALLINYFPRTIELYQALEEIADLPSQMSLEPIIKRAAEGMHQDWVCQDWADSCRAKTGLERANLEIGEMQISLQQVHSDLYQEKVRLEQAQVELQDNQGRLQHAYAELEQAQIALQQVQSELQQTQVAFQQVQVESQQAQTAFEQMQIELQQTKTELQEQQAQVSLTQLEAGTLRQKLYAMESSKFWKIRKAWFRLKSLVGLKEN